MKIQRPGDRPSGRGPADQFTGTVRRDPLCEAEAPGRALVGLNTFEPGARTAWHTHPLGQTLVITAGCGWVQTWGGPVNVVRPGDVVWIPAGEKHWHGAPATAAMSHIAVTEARDGDAVTWLEHVTEDQYRI